MNKVVAWLKKYWYYLVALISALLIFRRGKSSFGNLFKKIYKIKKESDDTVGDIEDKADSKVKDLEIINTRDKKHIQEKKLEKLEAAKEELEKKLSKLENSEEINSELNELL